MVKGKTVEWNTEGILENLRDHLKEQRSITLYNTYRGVPITYKAEVAMVHPAGYVGLIVHPYQAVCIKHERRTYLESKTISELVRAYPVSIDYTNQVVLLKRLKIPRKISVDLDNSWVSPEEPVKVEMDLDLGVELTGKLLELAVLAENVTRVVVEVSEDVPYAREDEIELTFKLPKSGELVQVQGVVYSLTKVRNQEKKRLEVDGKAAMQDEISLLAYIARREDEIIGALDKEYQKLRKVKRHRKK
jgi:hypothetical protein